MNARKDKPNRTRPLPFLSREWLFWASVTTTALLGIIALLEAGA